MADTIGGLTFIRLDGFPQPAGQKVIEITRPGVDGVAFKQSGIRGFGFTLTGVVDSVTSNLTTALKAIEGTIVSLTIRGVTFSSYIVLRADQLDAKFVSTPVGGINGGNWLCRCSFDLQAA